MIDIFLNYVLGTPVDLLMKIHNMSEIEIYKTIAETSRMIFYNEDNFIGKLEGKMKEYKERMMR